MFSPIPSVATSPTSSTGLLDPGAVVQGLSLQSGMHVADFGCGSGHFTILIAERVGPEGRVTALDVQEPPLESVRARAKERGLTNIETVRANLEVSGSSRLSDNSQDLVLLANILFQSKNKSAIIGEAKRVIKPNGKLILIEWKKGSGGFGPPDDLRLDEGEIQQLMTTEGFAQERDIDVGQYHHVLTLIKT